MKYLALLLFSVSCLAQHGIDITTVGETCTAANPCTLQVYRAQCTGISQTGAAVCPVFPDPSYLLLANSVQNLNASFGTTNTRWIFHDRNGDSTRPDLVPALVYGYVVTDTYNADPTRTASLATGPTTIPFQLNQGNAPVYPVTGTCVIVK